MDQLQLEQRRALWLITDPAALMVEDKVDHHVEFSLNRTVTGWVVGLINHQGVEKRAIEPAVLDASKKQTARITARHGEWKEALEWTGDRKLDVRTGTMQLEVPAGEVRIVEFRTTSI